MTKPSGSVMADHSVRRVLEIRASIAALKDEIARTAAAIVPFEAARDRMLAGFREMENVYLAEELDFQSLTHPEYSGSGLRPIPCSTDYVAYERVFNGAIWHFFGKTMAPLLEAGLKDFYRTHTGLVLGEAEREEKIRTIQARILELEFEEEDIISAAAEVGLEIPRRGDADPRAVLNVREGA